MTYTSGPRNKHYRHFITITKLKYKASGSVEVTGCPRFGLDLVGSCVAKIARLELTANSIKVKYKKVVEVDWTPWCFLLK
jgi:hypothetical protein